MNNESEIIAAAHGIVDSYQYYGQNDEENKVGSIDADSDGVVNPAKKEFKETNIEVLDEERPIGDYYKGENGGDQESGDLLKKLIDNLNSNPALQN